MQDDTQPAGGSYPVYLGRDDVEASVSPAAYTDDPIAAAHWDEIQWRNGALPGARVYTSVPQG
ncbi:hypothetical protein [Rhodococcoides kroppenstedtii]|uniref:hypothetical protein n=1 Tax=Rhodococcoides kroppenstedtii TaxID=293050 RepID=UPI0028E2D600|nr:hypothetical protein [Rhodococcus kroppenstedtii]